MFIIEIMERVKLSVNNLFNKHQGDNIEKKVIRYILFINFICCYICIIGISVTGIIYPLPNMFFLLTFGITFSILIILLLFLCIFYYINNNPNDENILMNTLN